MYCVYECAWVLSASIKLALVNTVHPKIYTHYVPMCVCMCECVVPSLAIKT